MEREKARLRIAERIKRDEYLERESLAAEVLRYVPEHLHKSLDAESIKLLQLVTNIFKSKDNVFLPLSRKQFDKHVPRAVEVILSDNKVHLSDDVVAWLEELATAHGTAEC